MASPLRVCCASVCDSIVHPFTRGGTIDHGQQNDAQHRPASCWLACFALLTSWVETRWLLKRQPRTTQGTVRDRADANIAQVPLFGHDSTSGQRTTTGLICMAASGGSRRRACARTISPSAPRARPPRRPRFSLLVCCSFVLVPRRSSQLGVRWRCGRGERRAERRGEECERDQAPTPRCVTLRCALIAATGFHSPCCAPPSRAHAATRPHLSDPQRRRSGAPRPSLDDSHTRAHTGSQLSRGVAGRSSHLPPCDCPCPLLAALALRRLLRALLQLLARSSSQRVR